jgi:hypothetical protein
MPLSWAIPLGTSLLGGLFGSEEKTVGKTNPTSQTTVSSGGSSRQDRIDPRMEQAIYGAGGIMPNAAAWYAKNQSGLNDQMVQGMNNQWNQLGASAQGFNQMQNLGMGLMGGGAAGNPFTGGGGIAPQQMSYTPAQMNNSGANPFTMPTPTTAPAMGEAGGGGGGGGGGAGYQPRGLADMVGGGLGAALAGAGEQAEPMYDVEGMLINRSGGNAGASGYRTPAWNGGSDFNMPTTSTAGYGGYGGYSTLPAYSYPSSSGGGE